MRWIWDTSAWYGIRRRRVFLCSYLDTDVPVAIPVPSDDGWGPLLYQNLQPIPLAPLLRSRGFTHDCVLKLSWTGYQPHAVMWDYSHFGGKAASAAHCQMLEGSKIPNLPWAGIIPAHFLGIWREFLQTIKADQSKQNRRDELIDQLVPLFHNPNIRLPIRILTVREVRSLAGLTDILPSDKHNPVVMTEKVVRDFCGNSLHPGLIDAALGTDKQFRAWAAGTNDAQACHAVAPPIKDVHQDYHELLKLVLAQGSKRGIKLTADKVDFEGKWHECATDVSGNDVITFYWK